MTPETQIVHLARELANLGEWIPAPAVMGTPEREEQYRAFTLLAKKHFDAARWQSKAGLTAALIGLEGRRVEVTDEDGQKRRFNVGKSTGWVPCHLEIKTSRSLGGSPVYGPLRDLSVIR